MVLDRGKGGPIRIYVWGKPEVVTQYVRVPKYVATVTKYVTAVTTKTITLPSSYVSALVSRWSAIESAYSSMYSPGGDVSRTVSSYASQLQGLRGAGSSAGVWGKYVDEANTAIAVVAALGVALSESTYDNWMGALVAARKVLVDPNASPKAKARAALVIQLLYPQIINALKQHVVSITKTGAHPGVVAAEWNRSHMTTINLSGITIQVPEGLANDIKKYLEEVEQGKVPGKSVAQQVIYGVERALNTAAFWPQWLAESLAASLEEKAAQASNPYEKWFYQALAATTRAGGAAATAVWDTLLTAMTGGVGSAVIASAAADQLSRLATDPMQREALKQAFTDPQLFATRVLPILIGGAVGGAASVKGLSAATDWVLKNLNAGGKTGALARALFKICSKNGIFKTVTTFTDPQGAEVKVLVGKNGDLYIISREWGVLRFDSKTAPQIEQLSVKLGAISKSPYGEEAYLVFKEAALTHNTKALELLNELIDLAGKGGTDTAWVKACLEAIRKNLKNPDKLAAVEAYVRLSRGELKGVAVTKFAGIINNSKVAGLIKEAYAAGGDKAVYKLMEWLLTNNPSDETISFISKFYKLTGVNPSELDPSTVATLRNLNPHQLSQLEDMLKEAESLIKQSRGAGRADLTPTLQQALSKYKSLLGEEPIRQIITKYLSSKGVDPSKVLGKSSWGITVKVIGNQQAWIIDYGTEGPVTVMGKGISQIDKALLNKLASQGSGKYVSVTSTTLSDDAYDALVKAVKAVAQKHGVHAVRGDKIIVPKSWAKDVINELKSMGVSIDTDILQRLANSVSNKAELVISGKKATLIIPSKDAPIIGNYVITRVIRIKASDVKGLDVRQLVNEMIAEAKQLSSQEGIPLDQAFLKAGERAAAKIQQLASKIKDPKAKQELLARAKLVEELAQKLAQSSDYAKQLGGARIVVNVGADGSVYTAVLMSTTSGAAQSTQQSMTQASSGESVRGNQLLSMVAKKFGVSLAEAESILQQLQAQAKGDITKTINNLKVVQVEVSVPQVKTIVKEVPKEVTITVPQSLTIAKSLREVVVPVQIPKPQTVVKEVTIPIVVDVPISASITKPLRVVPIEIDIPKPETIVKDVTVPVVIEDLTGLSITKPLRLVEVEVDIPRLKTVTVEVPKVVTIEDYTSASVTGEVIQIPVLKTITVTVPYYQVIDVPVDISSNTPPPPNKPSTPVPVPPATIPPLPPINYGQLPAGAFRPPKRRKQEEVVMI